MNRRDFAKKAFMGSAMFAAAPLLPLPMEKGTDFIGFDDVVPQFRPLFNGRNLDGFVDMNTSEDTWRVEDGILQCTGEPIGVMRTEKQYENFILDIEWRHMEPGGNSGVFVWADGTPYRDNPFPTGMEVQMLDPQWAEINDRALEYAHGHLFPVMGLDTAIPDNPSEVAKGRSYSLENRVKGMGEWNRYIVACIDGTLKLAINGKFVNGIRSPKRKKGYICPESEGFEVQFRKIDIMELPGGVLKPEQAAPKVD